MKEIKEEEKDFLFLNYVGEIICTRIERFILLRTW